MKTKKWSVQNSLAKAILALVAAAVPLLVRADTSWVRGGNWAATDGLVSNVVAYPDGITSSTTPTQAAAVADTIAADYHSVGINFVRYPINPATVSGNWLVTKAAIDELIADGLFVDICCWYVNPQPQGGNGLIRDMNTWESMWRTVDGYYGSNNNVYYEPINEPSGYTAAGLESVYTTFLGLGLTKGHSFIILDGTGYADSVAAIGADSSLSGCTLAVHDYPFWNSTYTTESQWESELNTEVAGYQSRTIMTEFGAPTTTGLDYDQSANDNNISFLRGMCEQCRAWPMGSVWFPTHQAGSGNNKRLFSGPGGAILNRSAVNELQYGWNFFTPVSAADCDFNEIGTTAYSVFRPSNSGWYTYPSVNPIQFGASTDIAVPADYDGTGQAQPAVWRPSTGDWYVYPSVNPIHWGTTGDIPVPGDYAGTGQAQLATWRPSNGTWYVDGVASLQWGTNGDIPVPGYYLGDGHLDYAVYRPSNNKWYIYGATTVQFGIAGDIPVPGDYAGDGTTQIATWRPSNGNWYISGVGTTAFGINGDIPVPGDYAGDGSTQMATWRPSNNNWYVNGVGIITNWGTTGDAPLPLPYAIRHYSLGYNN